MDLLSISFIVIASTNLAGGQETEPQIAKIAEAISKTFKNLLEDVANAQQMQVNI